MAEAILAHHSGIYSITNSVNGKRYVGSAVKLRNRFNEHKRLLAAGRHHSPTLQRSWAKYGQDSFSYEVLEFVECKFDLVRREQFWLDCLGTAGKGGFNISPTAGSPLGVKHTDAARLNMRNAALGRKATPEAIENMRIASTGRKMSADAIAKRISSRMRGGSYFSPETTRRMTEAKLGVPRSQETKEKIRRKLTGRTIPDAIKEKLRIANTGKKMSADAIARTAAAHRGKILSQEMRDRISKALRGRVPPAEEVAKMAAIKRTPESRENARQKQLGKKLSPESIAKRTATQKANRAAKAAAAAT